MVFYLCWFIAAWTAWLLLADKRRWREMAPVCTLASLLGILTDNLMDHYPLWQYAEPELFSHLADDFAIYIVVTYLFIQWLPARRTPGRMLRYWFLWTAAAITIETIYWRTGHIVYHQWWNMLCSYTADWILFWVFYSYHKLLSWR